MGKGCSAARRRGLAPFARKWGLAPFLLCRGGGILIRRCRFAAPAFDQFVTATSRKAAMKITVETVVNAWPKAVWRVWNNPGDIIQWNSPHESWQTTRSAVDLREGGQFSARMEAKDGSAGFEFEGTYTRVVPNKAI